eukprot:scaffold130822_cov39-Attheya_sp.AAC.2
MAIAAPPPPPPPPPPVEGIPIGEDASNNAALRFEDLTIDDDLPLLDRVVRYCRSGIALQRLVHVKMLAETASSVGEDIVPGRETALTRSGLLRPSHGWWNRFNPDAWCRGVPVSLLMCSDSHFFRWESRHIINQAR